MHLFAKHRGQYWAAVTPLLCVLAAIPPDGAQPPTATQTGRHFYFTAWGSPAFLPAEPDRRPATPTAYSDCGPDARPETGLQGQVPVADQASGRAKDGYRCNLRRVGHNDIAKRGQNWQLAWSGDCAYVSTIGLREDTGRVHEPNSDLDGIGVVDAADPRNPRLVGMLKSPIARNGGHEALEVHPGRGLLVASQGGLQAQYLEVYDVADDCRKPRFLGRYDAGTTVIHGLRLSPDGRTAYVTDPYDIYTNGQIMHAVDISDPRNPKRLLRWGPETEPQPDQFGIHDLDVNDDGSRLYVGTAPFQAAVGVLAGGPPTVGPGTSLAILDSSEVQQRRQEPDVRIVSRLSLPNIGHTVQRMRIGGKPYLLVSGEAPFGGPQNCPWAWGHIVDISDERNPRRVSDLRLEVNDIANCDETARDEGAVYSIHYAGVDDEHETGLVFYTYYSGGLRVFDVRDPFHPKEVAYYQPPATPGTRLPAASPVTPDNDSDVLDYATSVVRFRPETGEIWMVSVNAGFQILQLRGRPAEQDATLEVIQRRAATAARRGAVAARLTCAQPCRASLRLLAGSRRSPARDVSLGRNGSAIVELRLGAAARRALRRSKSVRVGAEAAVADRLTGEAQSQVSAPRRRLRR